MTMRGHTHSNCEYNGEGNCISNCDHMKENCALYHKVLEYNHFHKAELVPIEFLVAKLENRHFSDLEAAVVIKALGIDGVKI